MSFKDFSTAQNDPAKANPAASDSANDPKAAPVADQPSGPPAAPAPSETPAKS
jgi:hypothetical protein